MRTPEPHHREEANFGDVSPLPIGRFLNESSPVMVVTIEHPDNTPSIKRAPVPLFWKSSTHCGSRKPSGPMPVMRSSLPSSGRASITTPNARRTFAVDCGSLLESKPFKRLFPDAIDATIRARWVMDLSPGTLIFFTDSASTPSSDTPSWGYPHAQHPSEWLSTPEAHSRSISSADGASLEIPSL